MRRFEVVKQVILRAEVLADTEEEAEAWAENTMVDFMVTQDHVLTSLTKDLGPAPDETPATASGQLTLPHVA